MGESLLSLDLLIACPRSRLVVTHYPIQSPALNESDTKTCMAFEMRFDIVR